jgi:hypothetical protein
VNLHVAKMDTALSGQTAQTRQFDAQWIAPLSFLDRANERGMISRGLDQARIGRLVLVTGELALFDLSVIQSMWGISHVKTILINAMAGAQTQLVSRPERRKLEKPSARKASPELEAAIELLKLSPHRVLATIRAGGQCVWSSLTENGLMVPASDLMLKHGIAISGLWSMVGVIDALPDDINGESAHQSAQAGAAESLGSFGVIIGGLAPAIRGMLGRPKDAFGMTPLLIFREVSG